MILWLKILWRRLSNYSQDAAIYSIIFSSIAFIKPELIDGNLLWVLWCGLLVSGGKSFWQSDISSGCHHYWINKSYANKIIHDKWYGNLLFAEIFWLCVWAAWYIIFDIKMPALVIFLIISGSIPIVLGFSIIVASLSIEVMSSNNLLSFICMPLLAPVFIYGSGVFSHVANHENPYHILSGIAALAVVITAIVPTTVLKIFQKSCRS